ncbi:MAG: O-antigen ligase family protein [Pseudothermotoga sp.]
MSKVEEIFIHITVIVVALFANKFVTYEFSVPKYAILTAFALILAAVLVYRAYKERELKLYFSMANLSWFLFSIASLLSTITVYRENRLYFKYSIDIAIFVLLTALIGLYVSNKFRTKEHITRILLTFVGTGTIVAIDALLNFYTGKSIFLGTVGEPFSRASIKSTIGNTIFVANYMTMLLIISLYFIFSFDFGWKKYSYKNTFLIKVFSLVTAFLALITIIVSQTRSEYISLILSTSILISFYLIYSKKTQVKIDNEQVEKDHPRLHKLNRLLLVILCVGVLAILIAYSTDNPLTGKGQLSITSRFSAMASVSSRDERFLAWLASIYQWKDNKILGDGIGTYQVKAIDTLEEAMKDHPDLLYGWNNFKRTHNDYLQVLGETGVLGFASIVLLAIVLIVYAFRYLGSVTNRDDLLLFLIFACAFIGFMIQSFFSFPGHLLPNSLLALFVAATATGRYFNERKIMAWEIKLKRFGLALSLILVMVITSASAYLKWNYFISEVHFKNGNNYYNGLISISNDKNLFQQYEKTYAQKLEELNTLTGEFTYLRPENYKYSNLSGVELEKQRIKQIATIRAELEKNLSTIRNNLKKAEEFEKSYTQKAEEALFKALKLNRIYGKSYFYLASLSLRPLRIEKLTNALTKKDYSVLRQEFDLYQEYIAAQYRDTDLLFTTELLEKKPELTQVIATMQAIVDSCGLFKTSLLSFNERNTYKGLATRYHSLCDAIDQLVNQLETSKDDPVVQQAIDEFKKLRERYLEEFIRYAKATVDKLPGGWNRFPDWKNLNLYRAISGEDIYRLMATLAVSINSVTDEKIFSLIEYLAQKESWACEGMASKGVWAVPDGVAEYLWAAAAQFEKSDSERAKDLYRKMMQLYQPAYSRIGEDIKRFDVEKIVEKYLGDIAEALSNALLQSGVSVDRVEAVKGTIGEFIPQIQRYLRNIDWEAIVRAELNSIVYDKKYNQKFTLTNSIPNALKNEVLNLITLVIKDQTKASQAFDKVSSAIVNLPSELLLWERESRFLAFYQLLSSKQKDFAMGK